MDGRDRMESNKRKLVHLFLLAATLSIMAGSSANPLNLENAESSLNQDLKSQSEQRDERFVMCITSPCPYRGLRFDLASADEERGQRSKWRNFWKSAGMHSKHFVEGFLG